MVLSDLERRQVQRRPAATNGKTMKPTITISSLSVLLACLTLSAQESPQPARGGGLAGRFKQLDRNGDGNLTRDEVPSSLPFDEWDANKDGVVKLDEVKAYYTKPRAGVGPAKPAAQPAPVTTGALFRRIDIPGFSDIVEGTNGIALADLNHDGLVDIVATYTEPKRGLSASGHHLRVFVNQGELRFQPHAIRIRDSQLTAAEFGRNPEIPNLVDFNGDGLLDILITRSSPMLAGKKLPFVEAIGNTLLLSDGAWDTFRDVSARLGARNETAYNRQSSIADVNKDGWLDIAIGCDNIGNAIGGVSHSRLYVFKPNGAKFEDGRFEDIGGTALVPDFGGFYHDSAKDKAGPDINLRDLDGDGKLDLLQSYHVDVLDYSAPYSPIEYRQGVFCWKNLLAKAGKLQFEKITGNGLACEGRLKLSADKQSTEPVGKAPGLPYISLADVDNDGLPDVLAIGPASPGWAPRTEYVSGRFWRNKGNFQFQEATDAAGLSALNWVYRDWFKFFDAPLPPGRPGARIAPGDGRPYFAAIIFGDFDNDGWVDLVVQDRSERQGEPVRAILFMNRGDGTFEVKPTTFSGLDSHGICGVAADLNNDGLLDLVFAADPDNSGVVFSMDRYESKVYWNTGARGARSNHWLRLRFSGTKDAELIGARVELTAAGKKQYRWIHPDHFYKSGCALEAHFGLAKQTKADVKVTLLNGKTATFSSVMADQFLDLNLKTSQSTPAGKEPKP
jgi:hypothetical protein